MYKNGTVGEECIIHPSGFFTRHKSFATLGVKGGSLSLFCLLAMSHVVRVGGGGGGSLEQPTLSEM